MYMFHVWNRLSVRFAHYFLPHCLYSKRFMVKMQGTYVLIYSPVLGCIGDKDQCE